MVKFNMVYQLKCCNSADITSALIFGLNRIRESNMEHLRDIPILKFDQFYTSIVAFEAFLRCAKEKCNTTQTFPQHSSPQISIRILRFSRNLQYFIHVIDTFREIEWERERCSLTLHQHWSSSHHYPDKCLCMEPYYPLHVRNINHYWLKNSHNHKTVNHSVTQTHLPFMYVDLSPSRKHLIATNDVSLF